MKKGLGWMLVLVLSVVLAGCGNQNMVNEIADNQQKTGESGSGNGGSVTEIVTEQKDEAGKEPSGAAKNGSTSQKDIVDLTKLNSTMVYSEVYNMMAKPEDYAGKQIKMQGNFSTYLSDNGKRYNSCIIQDATQCCAQGLEFELKSKYHYPDDYPKLEDEIVVTGRFDTYDEEGYTYCIIRDADLKK